MTTEQQQTTQGDVDTTTPEEQRILDEQRAQQDAERKAAEDAAAAKAAEAEIAAASEKANAAAAAAIAAAPPPIPIIPPTVLQVDEALAQRDFDAERKALQKRWEEGDIEQTEYDSARDAITEAKALLIAQRQLAEASKQQHAAWLQQQQELTAANFAQAASAFVAQCPDLQVPARHEYFRELLVKVDNETGNKLSDADLLQTARARMLEAFPWHGVTAATPAQPAAPTPQQQRQAQAPNPPPRLAGIPAGAAVGVSTETLISAPVTDIEDYLASLTPDARDSFLRKVSEAA